MEQRKKFTLQDMKGDLGIYLNWSANVLVPISPGAADDYLAENRNAIINISQQLLKLINYKPGPIWRGIILEQPVNAITPNDNMQYLSFSEIRSVAEHFADINGFGSKILNVSAQLGHYGYIIEYIPEITEVLFHHEFLSILPYAEAFSLLRMNGKFEVKSLEKQKEITITQPLLPFSNIKKYGIHPV